MADNGNIENLNTDNERHWSAYCEYVCQVNPIKAHANATYARYSYSVGANGKTINIWSRMEIRIQIQIQIEIEMGMEMEMESES